MPAATLEKKELKPGFGPEIVGLDVSRASASGRAGVVEAFQRPARS